MNIPSTICLQTLQQQREFAGEVKRRWRNGATIDAHAAIDEFGSHVLHKSVVIELAYEEYCQRTAAGENLPPDDFAKQFPDVEFSLRRQIDIHQFLSHHSFHRSQSLPDWPEAGDEVAGFLLKEELGRGAFGRVFLAHELKLRERTVVVKVSRHGLREAQILAQVSHPGIVPIYSAESDLEWGLTTICMPFDSRATLLDVLEFIKIRKRGQLDGNTIRVAVADRNCSDDPVKTIAHEDESNNCKDFLLAVVQFARLLADALSYRHQKGVQHRDLKPSNILVNAAGQPLLIDFNLSTEPSSDEFVGGTLPYMSPEQLMSVLGASQASGFEIPSIDPRSDLYAVGVCLYQLWNGQHPLGQIPHDLSQLDLADYLLERQALGPISVNRPTGVREAALCNLIDRCLSYYADERPATADELLSELDAIQNLYVSKKSHPGRWARPWVAAIAVSCLIVAVLLLWSGLQAETPTLPDLPNEARKEILRRDFDSAIVVLNDALRSNPDDGALLAMRGRARLELGFYSEASDDFAAAYRHDPSINSATFAAYCTAKLNRYSSAMEWYRIVVAERSDSLSVRNNYGYVLLMASRYEESLEQLNAAIKLDDKSIEPRISRAIVRLHLAENGGEPPGATMREDLAMAMKNSIWQSATTTLALARAAAMTDQISEQNVIQAIVATLRAGTSIEIIKKDPVFTRWLSRDRFATLPQVKLREGDVDERRLLYPW